MSAPSTDLLSKTVPPTVRELVQRLHEAGHRAWVVGGCVRDILQAAIDAERSGSPVETARARSDWDIATDARPEQVRGLFRRVIPTGIQHGTVTVMMGSEGYEVTTLRGETTYTDGRHPDSVYFVDDITDDLARRDFTVNAIAYDPVADRLIDPFGGASDLVARRLKAVGDPVRRFSEDGLRVLRAARFTATLGFELDPATSAAIRPCLDTYRKVSPERVRDEWIKCMKADKPSRAFEIMREHGILEVSAPELMESVGCEQNRYHAFDVWYHALACLDACPVDPVLRVAGLLHDVGKPRTRAYSDKTEDYTFYDHERVGAEIARPMLERLRFSNEERDRIVALIRHHLVCYDSSWSDAAVRRWIRRVTPELVEPLYALNEADVRGKGRDASVDLLRLAGLREHVAKVRAAGPALSVRELRINGHDLMRELGLPAGRVVGDILAKLLEEVIERPELNEPAALLARARALVEETA